MEIYDISIAPGQVRDIFVNGSYVYFYSGSAGGADATITVNQDSRGQRVLLMPGQAYRMPDGQVGTRWLIGNLKGEGTIAGRLVIGAGELTDNRVTGSVEVIDGEKSRTLSGGNYIGAPTLFGTATEYPITQLWNPAGSGVNLVVQRVAGTAPINGAQSLYWSQAELTTDLTPTRAGNKRSDKAIGIAKVKAGRTTSATPPAVVLIGTNVQANVLIEFGIKGNMVVTPGWGLNVRSYVLNEPHSNIFEWFEESTQ